MQGWAAEVTEGWRWLGPAPVSLKKMYREHTVPGELFCHLGQHALDKFFSFYKPKKRRNQWSTGWEGSRGDRQVAEGTTTLPV